MTLPGVAAEGATLATETPAEFNPPAGGLNRCRSDSNETTAQIPSRHRYRNRESDPNGSRYLERETVPSVNAAVGKT